MAKAPKRLPNRFAVKVANPSMRPAYCYGDTIYADLTQPVRPGNDYVFVTSRTGSNRKAMLARLVGITARHWHVRLLAESRAAQQLSRREYRHAARVYSVEFADAPQPAKGR